MNANELEKMYREADNHVHGLLMVFGAGKAIGQQEGYNSATLAPEPTPAEEPAEEQREPSGWLKPVRGLLKSKGA